MAALGDEWLLTLLDRSRRLYIRVARLDEMVRREAALVEPRATLTPS